MGLDLDSFVVAQLGISRESSKVHHGQHKGGWLGGIMPRLHSMAHNHMSLALSPRVRHTLISLDSGVNGCLTECMPPSFYFVYVSKWISFLRFPSFWVQVRINSSLRPNSIDRTNWFYWKWCWKEMPEAKRQGSIMLHDYPEETHRLKAQGMRRGPQAKRGGIKRRKNKQGTLETNCVKDSKWKNLEVFHLWPIWYLLEMTSVVTMPWIPLYEVTFHPVEMM